MDSRKNHRYCFFIRKIGTPYTEHAKSYLKKQPTHQGMIYPPEAVAEAILYSAENRKRDMYVGSQVCPSTFVTAP